MSDFPTLVLLVCVMISNIFGYSKSYLKMKELFFEFVQIMHEDDSFI